MASHFLLTSKTRTLSPIKIARITHINKLSLPYNSSSCSTISSQVNQSLYSPKTFAIKVIVINEEDLGFRHKG